MGTLFTSTFKQELTFHVKFIKLYPHFLSDGDSFELNNSSWAAFGSHYCGMEETAGYPRECNCQREHRNRHSRLGLEPQGPVWGSRGQEIVGTGRHTRELSCEHLYEPRPGLKQGWRGQLVERTYTWGRGCRLDRDDALVRLANSHHPFPVQKNSRFIPTTPHTILLKFRANFTCGPEHPRRICGDPATLPAPGSHFFSQQKSYFSPFRILLPNCFAGLYRVLSFVIWISPLPGRLSSLFFQKYLEGIMVVCFRKAPILLLESPPPPMQAQLPTLPPSPAGSPLHSTRVPLDHSPPVSGAHFTPGEG